MKLDKRLTVPRLMVEGAGQCADLIYASGFFPVDPVVFLDEGNRRSLVVPMLEYGRAKQESAGTDIFLPENIGVPYDQRRSVAKWALFLLQYRKIKQVEVTTFFPAGIARILEQHHIRIDIQQAALYPERAVKNADEIKNISESQRAAVAAMREAQKILRTSSIGRGNILKWKGKSLSSERVREVIDFTLLKYGCVARDTIVAGGAQAADPHDRGSGPLKAGESIVVDIFPQSKRHHYWGDITRTFCKGTPPPQLARMYATVLTAQKKALAMIKPGIIASDVHSMISSYFEEQGFPTTVKNGVVRGFFHGTGHGVGLEIHEMPSIGLSPVKLLAGQVITVEPGLYDPDTGGIRIEDTVVVERGGARILATYPKVFRV